MLVLKYSTNVRRIKKKYKEEVRLIKYWNKIEKVFIKHRKNLDREFVYEFKHYNEYDDEMKIKSIASENGYKIVDEDLKMNLAIQILMISAAALIILFCKANPKKVVTGAVWQAGMTAVVAIFGIAWMADTYFSNFMPEIQSILEGVVSKYPWAIALVFFVVSILITSQGAVVVAIIPLAYSIGIPGPVLLGVLPSVYGYFFIPSYPSDIATVNFDRSGTTRIGKYLLNHSFMMPGLVSVGVATVVAYLLAMLIY